jgi:putative glutamine amidotransferase
MGRRPRIGITVDNRDNCAASGRYESTIAYSRGIAEAGGLPMLLPHEPTRAADYVRWCDGLILTGGVDPRTEAFGEPTDVRARPMDETRQRFELGLLAALDEEPGKALLGVCLGMQLMALHHGGSLDQYMPATMGDAAAIHADNQRHPIDIVAADGVLGTLAMPPGTDRSVISAHRQAVRDAGRLRVAARGPGEVIEAIDDPSRRFYLGVQWHPERGGAGALNADLLACLVRAAATAT